MRREQEGRAGMVHPGRYRRVSSLSVAAIVAFPFPSLLPNPTLTARNVDDAPPALLLHMRQAGLCEVERSVQVDGVHLLPLLWSRIQQLVVGEDARHVNQDIGSEALGCRQS